MVTPGVRSIRKSKRTANPASADEKRTVSRLIFALIRSGYYASKDEAQADFLEMTGYESVRDLSTTGAKELMPVYRLMLKTHLRDRRERRQVEAVHYQRA